MYKFSVFKIKIKNLFFPIAGIELVCVCELVSVFTLDLISLESLYFIIGHDLPEMNRKCGFF